MCIYAHNISSYVVYVCIYIYVYIYIYIYITMSSSRIGPEGAPPTQTRPRNSPALPAEKKSLRSEVWALIWTLRPFRGMFGTFKGTCFN